MLMHVTDDLLCTAGARCVCVGRRPPTAAAGGGRGEVTCTPKQIRA